MLLCIRVQVDDNNDDFYDGPDDIENESDDSNGICLLYKYIFL